VSYTQPKDVLNAVIQSFKDASEQPLLSGAIHRKGPQNSVRLPSDGNGCVVFTQMEGLAEGERSAGSGNHWWHDWEFKVVLCVEDAPDGDLSGCETAEDTRLDLAAQYLDWIHENRNLFGTAKVGRVTELKFAMIELPGDPVQRFRGVVTTLAYKTLKGA
jgi:hypothetical protein